LYVDDLEANSPVNAATRGQDATPLRKSQMLKLCEGKFLALTFGTANALAMVVNCNL
jgi:hypothetical protein